MDFTDGMLTTRNYVALDLTYCKRIH